MSKNAGYGMVPSENVSGDVIDRSPALLWLLFLGAGVLSGPLMFTPMVMTLNEGKDAEASGDAQFFLMALLIGSGLWLGYQLASELEDSYRTSRTGGLWVWLVALLIPVGALFIALIVFYCLALVVLMVGMFLYGISGIDDY